MRGASRATVVRLDTDAEIDAVVTRLRGDDRVDAVAKELVERLRSDLPDAQEVSAETCHEGEKRPR